MNFKTANTLLSSGLTYSEDGNKSVKFVERVHWTICAQSKATSSIGRLSLLAHQNI